VARETGYCHATHKPMNLRPVAVVFTAYQQKATHPRSRWGEVHPLVLSLLSGTWGRKILKADPMRQYMRLC
jgi:hypothetical protein